MVNKEDVFRNEGAVVMRNLEPIQGLHFGRFGGHEDCKMELGHSATRRARSMDGLTRVKVWAGRGWRTAMPVLKVFCQMV